MNYKLILGATLVAVVLIFGGLYLTSNRLGNSPTGTKFATQRVSAVTWSLASSAATTTSLYNEDRNDRVIESTFVACDTVGTSRTAYTGAGLAALTIKSATTSANAPAIVTNTNLTTNFTAVATATVNMFDTTSTDPVLGDNGRVWPSGSYLSFFSNATNTASCTVGVKYVPR